MSFFKKVRKFTFMCPIMREIWEFEEGDEYTLNIGCIHYIYDTLTNEQITESCRAMLKEFKPLIPDTLDFTININLIR